MQMEQPHQQPHYREDNNDGQSSSGGSQAEIAQQMLMQEQFAAYEHHLQMQQQEEGQEEFSEEGDELSQSDFLGSHQDDQVESEHEMTGHQQQDHQQRYYHQESNDDVDENQLQQHLQMAYQNHQQNQMSDEEESGDEQSQSEQQQDGDDDGDEVEEQDAMQMDTERLRKLQQKLIQNNQNGIDAEESANSETDDVYEPVGRMNFQREEQQQQNQHWEGPQPDVSRQFGNCDLSEIQPNTLTSTTGILTHGLNSNLQQDVGFALAASNAPERQQMHENQQRQNCSEFPQKTREFQNVAEFLQQQRAEEQLVEERKQLVNVRGGGGNGAHQEQQEEYYQQDAPDQEEEEEDEGDDDAEIQEMKAKFNQILANFDNEHTTQQDGARPNANQPTTSQSTGYFKGGVPQELTAMAMPEATRLQHQYEAPIGNSSNELTMQAVSSAVNDNNTADAIETFKKRNIQNNMRQAYQPDSQDNDHHQTDKHLPVGGHPNQEAQQLNSQLQYQQEEEELERELEDFENMGNVINLQIGGENKDFFFRQRPESGKPPIPGKQLQQRRNTALVNQNGLTPDRAGMTKPPKIGGGVENRYTGQSNSTLGSSTTATSKPSWTEKQKIAAQMRQNALKYGNSRRQFNSNKGNGSGSRPRSSNVASKDGASSRKNQISHSHSERIFFNTGESQQRNQRTLHQRPQTAKVFDSQTKQRPVATSNSQSDFNTHQQKPNFITSSTPRVLAVGPQMNSYNSVEPTNLIIASSSNLQLSMPQQTQQSRPTTGSQRQRPQTAKYQPYAQSLAKPAPYKSSGVKGVPPKKKNDPVSRYQSMQNEWAKNNFLKKTKSGNGRKLELDRFNQWRKLNDDENSRMSQKKSGTVHKVLAANKNAKALGSDRRDEMRYALRAKISQKDYVDKDMKAYHYGKSGVELPNRTNIVSGEQAVAGSDVATQIAAAQHMLYLQRMQAQQIEEAQMQELAGLKAAQQRLLAENGGQGYKNHGYDV